MKKFLLAVILLVTSVSCQAQTENELIRLNSKLDTNAVILPDANHSLISILISKIIEANHYRTRNINDSLSIEIFNKYISSLDNNKIYFLKADIDEFAKAKKDFDDFIKKGELDIPYRIFNRFKQRLNFRTKQIAKVLQKEFDFSKNENYQPDRKNADWPQTIEEQNELWRKILKNDALNLKLSKKEWPQIQSTLLKRYQSLQKIILQYRQEDIFQLFMNSLGEVTDPHTNYFSPATKERFRINMSLSLEGIGATLRTKDNYTTVVSLVPGGPAFKSKKIFPNDKIVSVGQGENGELINVVGWRIDDVVQLIRGKKGTKVQLEILKADDTPDMPTEKIILVRDKIKLEEQAASKKIFQVQNNNHITKIGLINIPGFYSDFKAKLSGDPNYRSTTRDVKKIITELKKEHVDGIVIDLRNNGGGALDEAIQLVGLFIKKGPVVQVKNTRGNIDIGRDEDASVYYDGPLAVLVNNFSASASEIFSAAIQDYGRGLVIGNTTYGKGSVQNLIDLKRFIRNKNSKTGQLKLTIAKYYRITGSSTQNKGVKPDIEFPSIYDPAEVGESSYKSSLKWDTIGTTNFTKYFNIKKFVPELIKKHEKRIKSNLEFKFLQEDIAEYKRNISRKFYSLNFDKRKKEREKITKRKEKRKKLKMPKKTEIKETENNIDEFVKETGYILSDYILMLK